LIGNGALLNDRWAHNGGSLFATARDAVTNARDRMKLRRETLAARRLLDMRLPPFFIFSAPQLHRLRGALNDHP
jgi:hypothetical protein